MARAEKSLVIVESPAKARTIAAFLPEGFKVEASIGHIRDLPTSAKEIPAKVKKEPWARLGIDVNNDFQPLYIVPAEKKKQVQKLKDALDGVDMLYLATDEDREGESISWHLAQVLKPKVPQRRLVFHEITREAIVDALANPRELDERLVKAQETRRILDRLYGYEISPILWRKIKPRLSAGRVQSVAVRLVVERARQRQRFVRSTFWDLRATFATLAGETFEADLVTLGGQRLVAGRDFDPATGELKPGAGAAPTARRRSTPRRRAFCSKTRRARWSSGCARASSASTASRRSPTPPIRRRRSPPRRSSRRPTASCASARAAPCRSRSASTRTATSPTCAPTRPRSRTRRSRTSGTPSSRATAQEYLSRQPRQYQTKVKNAQEAHEAIRPSSVFETPRELERQLEADELRLYELIWKRTMACQMAEARGHRIVGASARRGAPPAHRRAGGDRSRRRPPDSEAAKPVRRDLPGARQDHRVPRLPARLRRRVGRPRERARGAGGAAAAGRARTTSSRRGGSSRATTPRSRRRATPRRR